jgi:transcriptional regulator with GAF, ATPase, and Fis domain/PAS domain-containing protein
MSMTNALMRLAWRPMSIAAVSLLLVPIVIGLGYRSFKATEKATLDEFNQRQLTMAREAAAWFEHHLNHIAEALRAIGRAPGMHQFDEDVARQVLALEMGELGPSGVAEIGVLDANGILRYSARAQQTEGDDFSQRSYFQKAKKIISSERYVIESIDLGTAEVRQIGVVVAVPMYEKLREKDSLSPSNTFAGMVICTLTLDRLTQKVMVPVKPSERGYAYLIDAQSEVLWAVDRSLVGENLLQKVEGFPAFRQIVEKMTSGNFGTGEYIYYRLDASNHSYVNEPEEKLIGYAPARLGNGLWAVGVWAPREDAKRLIHSAYLSQLLLVSFIVISILLGSSYALAMSYRYNKILEKEIEEKTKEFKESHLRLLTVLDSLDAAVYVADMETHEILFVNKYTRDHHGEMAGNTCWHVSQNGRSGPCDFCTNRKILSPDGQPAGVHVREFQDKVKKKWYQAHNRAIRWVDGRIVRLEIAADITDRKQAEEELSRSYREMGTFCRIIKEIGGQQSLDGVGTFLIGELQDILQTEPLLLYVLASDRSALYVLSDSGTSIVLDRDMIQVASATLEGLDGVTISPKNGFKPPLLPDSFPTRGQQVIRPFGDGSLLEGALVVACSSDSQCDENRLELAGLILEQTSGAMKRAVLHQEEIRALQGRLDLDITSEYSGIIGRDPAMQAVFKMIEDIAPTDATVLIQGESGTGKELVAAAIHRESPRQNKPFVIVNCSAYAPTLLESELFGHEKGAFTGAVRQKAGRFEQADGGTVFLDEIGEIPASAHIKLLRVIQTQRFERLGGERTLAVDVRIIAATNKDLIQEVKNGNFREDLYYRLNVIPVHLPPLKSRRNDIPLLALHFLRRYAREQGKEEITDISSEAMRILLDYWWPGNVRELENSIEYAVVLAKANARRIRASDLPSRLYEAHFPHSAGSYDDRTILENEKRLLIDVLEESNWNKSQAAQRLGISRSTLYGKLKRYKITQPATP